MKSNNNIAVQATWNEFRIRLIEAAKPYRTLCFSFVIGLLTLIFLTNGFDQVGFEATRIAIWFILFLIMPICIVYSVDIDVVGFALSVNQGIPLLAFFVWKSGYHIPILNFISHITLPPYSPPRHHLA